MPLTSDQIKEKIYDAQCIIDEATEGMSAQTHYEAYGRYGLDQLQGNGNPYDSSIQTLIDELKQL